MTIGCMSNPAPKPRGRPRTDPKTHVNLPHTVAPIEQSIAASLKNFSDRERAELLKRALLGTPYAPLVTPPAIHEEIAVSVKKLFDSLPHNSLFKREFPVGGGTMKRRATFFLKYLKSFPKGKNMQNKHVA